MTWCVKVAQLGGGGKVAGKEEGRSKQVHHLKLCVLFPPLVSSSSYFDILGWKALRACWLVLAIGNLVLFGQGCWHLPRALCSPNPDLFVCLW